MGLATNKPPKEPKKFSRNVSPYSEGGIGKRVQKRGLNLWSLKGFLAPTPSVRQPLFETSELSEGLKTSLETFRVAFRTTSFRSADVPP